MELIRVTKDNLECEHICCAISDSDVGAAAKKAWLAQRFDDGLVFLKGNVRGKCFIEYIPAKKAWAPIEAEGYMYINCFWVSGQFKGCGNANLLLDECLRDCRDKGMKGLVCLSSDKKHPFLSDSGYLRHRGFETADTAKPFYTLMYLPFSSDAEKPQFCVQAKEPHIDDDGFVLYWTQQCPFTARYVPLVQSMAEARGLPFKSVPLCCADDAHSAPAPFTTYSLFYNGELVSCEILSDKSFEKLLARLGL